MDDIQLSKLILVIIITLFLVIGIFFPVKANAFSYKEEGTTVYKKIPCWVYRIEANSVNVKWYLSQSTTKVVYVKVIDQNGVVSQLENILIKGK